MWKKPYCPRHFTDSQRRLFDVIVTDWQLGPGDSEMEYVRLACEAQGTLDLAQAELDRVGSLTFLDRFEQPRERPEVAVITRCRGQIARMVKMVGESKQAYERAALAVQAAERRAEAGPSGRRGGGRRYN
ncbi:MAG TPA: hypothetical protein VFW09_17825 [Solirubrobacteraceae bacterium]|nr:hypothetical protein [Solirubrobacteraceae bacterium]